MYEDFFARVLLALLGEDAERARRYDSILDGVLADCLQAGYTHVFFNNQKVQAELSHSKNAFCQVWVAPTSCICSRGFPAIWSIFEKYGVSEGTGSGRQLCIDHQFAHYVGSQRYTRSPEDTYVKTARRFSQRSIAMLSECGAFSSYALLLPDEDILQQLQLSGSVVAATCDFVDVPLRISQGTSISRKIAQYRLETGRSFIEEMRLP